MTQHPLSKKRAYLQSNLLELKARIDVCECVNSQRRALWQFPAVISKRLVPPDFD
jgi:hypothetical protein